MQRNPRILWSSLFCLLDTSSGAAASARQILLELKKRNYDVLILGSEIFDNARGISRLSVLKQDQAIKAQDLYSVSDESLTHNLIRTGSHRRHSITKLELSRWYMEYYRLLNEYRPDMVFYYGGNPEEWEISSQARIRNIPVLAYLANGNYHGGRWCRDTDVIVTNSNATVSLYKERSGFNAISIGSFVDADRIVASQKTRERVLFVNPSLEKGAVIVILVAMYLQGLRPDIKFEVVESRGNWNQLVASVASKVGFGKNTLSNVVVTGHSNDMRPVYGRARILIAPSLWWESSGRVLGEAMLNGIPVIYTDSGGVPEYADGAGLKLKLHKVMHQPPFNRLPRQEMIETIANWIISMFDDQNAYDAVSARALAISKGIYSVQTNTDHLEKIIEPFISKFAGNADTKLLHRAYHRHQIDH